MIAAATSTDFYRPWWKVAVSKASWTLKCFKCPGNFDLPIYTTILAKRLAIRREIGILFPDHDLMTDLQTWQITIKTNQSADAISKTQLSSTPSEIPADYTGVFCSCCFVTHLHVTVEPRWQKAMHGNFHWRYCQWQVTVWLFYTFSIVFPFYEFRRWLSHLSHLSPKWLWTQIRRSWIPIQVQHRVQKRPPEEVVWPWKPRNAGRLWKTRKFVDSWIPKIEWMEKNVTITYYNSITTSFVSESNPLRWLQAACMQHWQEALAYRSTPSKKGGSLQARCGLSQFKIWV